MVYAYFVLVCLLAVFLFVMVLFGGVWFTVFFYFVVVLFLIFSSLLCFAYFVLVCFLLTVFCNSFRLRQALSLSLN